MNDGKKDRKGGRGGFEILMHFEMDCCQRVLIGGSKKNGFLVLEIKPCI